MCLNRGQIQTGLCLIFCPLCLDLRRASEQDVSCLMFSQLIGHHSGQFLIFFWLHFSATSSNMRLVTHTCTYLTDGASPANTHWLKNTEHTQKDTHTSHTCVHFSLPHQQFLPMMHLCFCLFMLCKTWRLKWFIVIISVFSSFLKKI